MRPRLISRGHELDLSRRSFLRRSAYGLGGLALAELMGGKCLAVGLTVSSSTSQRTLPRRDSGAPLSGQGAQGDSPVHGGRSLAVRDVRLQARAASSGMASRFPSRSPRASSLPSFRIPSSKARGPFCEFKKWGESGQEISELFPNIGGIADQICIIRSMVTEQINHDPAHAFMNSGSILKGRPSMGSWLLYGLGAETDDLPGFIVLVSQGKGGGAQPVSARQWSSGFLPGRFQGIQFQSRGDAVHYIGNPDGVCQSTQRQVVEEVNRLNGILAEDHLDPEIQTRIAQYEMAFRMQSSVPDLTDFSSEPASMLEMYGVKEPGDGSFASNCLLARRLAERGVRFIQLYHRAWDHHSGIEQNLPLAAQETDQPSAALVKDLEQRGLLDDTLIIWGGEFGRTPMGQGSGRDHHILGFSIWLAGGGIKGGMTYGASDDFGYRAVENVVSMHDLHATLLYLCGIDHHRFSVKFQGLDARLTGVEPCKVLKPILA